MCIRDRRETREARTTEIRFPSEPQENLLYFIEKNAPLLEPWQREIVRIVRKVAQDFYPQRQTRGRNKGWATYGHSPILNTLYDQGLLADSFMLEFLQYHTSVVAQPAYNSRYYSGINPYALGFEMWKDIRRICEQPTDEDRDWFPELADTDWRKTFDFAMRNFKDESFIAQYLSPKLMRDFKLFSVLDDDKKDKLKIAAIHDEQGYRRVRKIMSDQYNLGSREPNIQVWNVDMRGDRTLTLRHHEYHRRPLGKSTDEVVKHVARLWGFAVRLEAVRDDGNVEIAREIKLEKRRH